MKTRDEARQRAVEIMGKLYDEHGQGVVDTQAWKLLDAFFEDTIAALSSPYEGREPIAETGAEMEVDADGWGHLWVIESFRAKGQQAGLVRVIVLPVVRGSEA